MTAERPIEGSIHQKAPEVRVMPAGGGELPGVADYYDLLHIVQEAVLGVRGRVFKTTLGPSSDLLWDRRVLSELAILDLWRLRRALGYFAEVLIPSISGRPDDQLRRLLPTPLRESIWHATEFFHQPDPFGHPSSFANERWLYINGICTDHTIAELNAQLISKLFWRPVSVIHNATNSYLLDLYECAFGKALNKSRSAATFTEPALQATIAVLAALCDRNIDKVVLIAHSQGTIVTANVLRAIYRILDQLDRFDSVAWPVAKQLTGEVTAAKQPHLCHELATVVGRFTEQADSENGGETIAGRLRKLEVYTFANCANWMCRPTFSDVYGDAQPYLEHFANRRDLVAHLGVLSELRGGDEPLVEIEGPVFENPDTWGHFLNAHYLLPMGDYLRKGGADSDAEAPYRCLQPGSVVRPKLWDYYEGGGQPAAAGSGLGETMHAGFNSVATGSAAAPPA